MIATVWLPMDISAHGGTIDRLISIVHWFMLALFVGWGAYFAYCLLKFRAKPGQLAQYAEIKAKPSKYAEIGVIAVEAFLLIGLAMPVWAYYRNEPPGPEDDPLQVRVVAQQFAWNIHYPGPDGKFGPTRPELVDEVDNPIGLDRDYADENGHKPGDDDIVSINNFHVPKNRKVLVRLSSKDVIHSFAVPLLRVKQDVIPGMEIPIWFEARKTNDEVRRELVETQALPESEDGIEEFVKAHMRSVSMASYKDGGGEVILGEQDWITEDNVKALMKAGVTEIEVAPLDPVNIQCAQLCGLGHYRMLGQMQILTPEAFDTWYAEANAEEEFFDEFE